MAELGKYLPKMDFFDQFKNLQDFISRVSYHYIMGGAALYLILTNSCRKCDVTNLKVSF